MQVVNLTPHAIVVGTEGNLQTFPASGTVARVSDKFEITGEAAGFPVFSVSYGEVEGLPSPTEGTIFIVSALVLAACAGRNDVFAPATGQAVRNDKGHVVSVPGFVQAPR